MIVKMSTYPGFAYQDLDRGSYVDLLYWQIEDCCKVRLEILTPLPQYPPRFDMISQVEWPSTRRCYSANQANLPTLAQGRCTEIIFLVALAFLFRHPYREFRCDHRSR